MEYIFGFINSINWLIVVISIGIALLVSLIIYQVAKFIKKRKDKWKATAQRGQIAIPQNEAIDSYINAVESRMLKSKIKFNARIFVVILFTLSILLFIFSLRHFKNFAASVLLSIAFFSLPDYIFFLIQDKINKRVDDQIVVGVRVFTSEFLKSRNIEKSMAETSQRVKDPVGGYFAEAYNDTLMGYRFETTVARMSEKNDNEYWKMFCQLLFQLREDSTVISLFAELVNRIERNIEASRHNDSSLSGERILALLMSLLPIPAYFVMRNIIPETTYFIQETAVGRFILIFTFVSTLLFLYVDKYSRKID